MRPVVAIAMSGGIDSLVSAYLIKKNHGAAFGIHFRTGFEAVDTTSPDAMASTLSDQIGIPVYWVDLSDRFRTQVVDYFVQAYRSGTTPNPCLVCNPAIKFDALFSAAATHGATHLATGHYARTVEDDQGRFHLLKGIDASKDQSYFLAFLSQVQLSRACFPLGGMTKSDVKKIASEVGLSPITPDESQDVCFIQEKNYTDFLHHYTGLTPHPGPVKTLDGRTIGRHDGLHRFTVGQRRGINCPASEPYYVIRLEPDTHTLFVGVKKELQSTGCKVSSPHWIVSEPEFPISAEVRLRYRHQAVPGTVSTKGDTLSVSFEVPQDAPTPGQGAVFYDRDEVLGAGIITS